MKGFGRFFWDALENAMQLTTLVTAIVAAVFVFSAGRHFTQMEPSPTAGPATRHSFETAARVGRIMQWGSLAFGGFILGGMALSRYAVGRRRSS
jgi:predicted alpha/beta-hydrolase family hydrolase